MSETASTPGWVRGGKGGGGGRAKAQGEAAFCCYIPVLHHNPADLQKASEVSTMICRWRNLTKEDKISRETNGESMERQSDETTDRGRQTGAHGLL